MALVVKEDALPGRHQQALPASPFYNQDDTLRKAKVFRPSTGFVMEPVKEGTYLFDSIAKRRQYAHRHAPESPPESPSSSDCEGDSDEELFKAGSGGGSHSNNSTPRGSAKGGKRPLLKAGKKGARKVNLANSSGIKIVSSTTCLEDYCQPEKVRAEIPKPKVIEPLVSAADPVQEPALSRSSKPKEPKMLLSASTGSLAGTASQTGWTSIPSCGSQGTSIQLLRTSLPATSSTSSDDGLTFVSSMYLDLGLSFPLMEHSKGTLPQSVGNVSSVLSPEKPKEDEGFRPLRNSVFYASREIENRHLALHGHSSVEYFGDEEQAAAAYAEKMLTEEFYFPSEHIAEEEKLLENAEISNSSLAIRKIARRDQKEVPLMWTEPSERIAYNNVIDKMTGIKRELKFCVHKYAFLRHEHTEFQERLAKHMRRPATSEEALPSTTGTSGSGLDAASHIEYGEAKATREQELKIALDESLDAQFELQMLRGSRKDIKDRLHLTDLCTAETRMRDKAVQDLAECKESIERIKIEITEMRDDMAYRDKSFVILKAWMEKQQKWNAAALYQQVDTLIAESVEIPWSKGWLSIKPLLKKICQLLSTSLGMGWSVYIMRIIDAPQKAFSLAAPVRLTPLSPTRRSSAEGKPLTIDVGGVSPRRGPSPLPGAMASRSRSMSRSPTRSQPLDPARLSVVPSGGLSPMAGGGATSPEHRREKMDSRPASEKAIEEMTTQELMMLDMEDKILVSAPRETQSPPRPPRLATMSFAALGALRELELLLFCSSLRWVPRNSSAAALLSARCSARRLWTSAEYFVTCNTDTMTKLHPPLEGMVVPSGTGLVMERCFEEHGEVIVYNIHANQGEAAKGMHFPLESFKRPAEVAKSFLKKKEDAEETAVSQNRLGGKNTNAKMANNFFSRARNAENEALEVTEGGQEVDGEKKEEVSMGKAMAKQRANLRWGGAIHTVKQVARSDAINQSFYAHPIILNDECKVALCIDSLNRDPLMPGLSANRMIKVQKVGERVQAIIKKMEEAEEAARRIPLVDQFNKQALQEYNELITTQSKLQKQVNRPDVKNFLAEMEGYIKPPGRLLEMWLCIFLLVDQRSIHNTIPICDWVSRIINRIETPSERQEVWNQVKRNICCGESEARDKETKPVLTYMKDAPMENNPATKYDVKRAYRLCGNLMQNMVKRDAVRFSIEIDRPSVWNVSLVVGASSALRQFEEEHDCPKAGESAAAAAQQCPSVAGLATTGSHVRVLLYQWVRTRQQLFAIHQKARDTAERKRKEAEEKAREKEEKERLGDQAAEGEEEEEEEEGEEDEEEGGDHTIDAKNAEAAMARTLSKIETFNVLKTRSPKPRSPGKKPPTPGSSSSLRSQKVPAPAPRSQKVPAPAPRSQKVPAPAPRS
ncbi:hypothetical protein CYMTET_9575, partial [Cymbomonas tetramitiformis]